MGNRIWRKCGKAMFEALTGFLPKLQNASFGKWMMDTKGDGTPENPRHVPFVAYDRVVMDFIDTAYRFLDQHEEMGLRQYAVILEESNIKWGSDSLRNADVPTMDGRTVMALIIGSLREERFCEGSLLSLFEDGSITKWLSRLKVIDEGESPV